MGLVSTLRSVATFVLFLVILDTAVVVAAAGSGAPVPDWLYFAPSFLGSPFFSAVQNLAGQNLNQASVNVYAAFFFYVVPSGLLFAATNLFLGAFAGLPMVAYKLAWAAGAPVAVIVAGTTVAAILQAMADIFLVDAIFAYIFGRPLLMEEVFGE
jgi:signal transduction histidine kinase